MIHRDGRRTAAPLWGGGIFMCRNVSIEFCMESRDNERKGEKP